MQTRLAPPFCEEISAIARDAQDLRAAAFAGRFARAFAWFARSLHPGQHAR